MKINNSNNNKIILLTRRSLKPVIRKREQEVNLRKVYILLSPAHGIFELGNALEVREISKVED
jgi:hypothetical protein